MLPDLNEGQTRDELAALAGVSGRTLDKAEKVLAEADPETVGKPN
jgi:DNA-binding XRE family transcriptional regulator